MLEATSGLEPEPPGLQPDASALLPRGQYLKLAGVVGIEPTFSDLETAVLPLDDTHTWWTRPEPPRHLPLARRAFSWLNHEPMLVAADGFEPPLSEGVGLPLFR